MIKKEFYSLREAKSYNLVNIISMIEVGVKYSNTKLVCTVVQLKNYLISHFFFNTVNKQLNDKERVAAALENPNLLDMVDECLAPSYG